MKDKQPSLLQDYHTYVSPLEVPDLFHLWCGISMVSACAQRKVWLDMGHFRLSPNFYVILNSPAGKCGKDTAMNIVRNTLAEVGDEVKTKSDSITMEAVFMAMEQAATTTNYEKTKYIHHSSLTIFATEMSLLIRHGDKNFVSALNGLFNTNPEFKYTTKTKGENILVNPFLNILAGTTPDWVSTNIQEDLLEGGFSARAMFVFSNTPKEPNPFPEITPEGKAAYLRILKRLEEILKIAGAYRLDPEAKKFYGEWYISHHTTICQNPKMNGFWSRKRIHLLKLAMIISMCEKDELLITHSDISRALAIINETEPTIEQSLKGIGRNILSPIAMEILGAIMQMRKVKEQDLFVSNYHRLSMEEFKEVIETLKAMGQISTEVDLTNTSRPVVWINYIGSQQKSTK